MYIKDQLDKILNTLPASAKLIAVSKTKPNSAVLEAYGAGQRSFGENKIQEMVDKYNSLPKDLEWHMIGHLQSNKVKYMAHFVHLIHGVDSFKTLKEINKQAKKHNRIINCLLQLKIAKEDSKFGLSISDANAIINSEEFDNLENIHISGLMGMASFTDDTAEVRQEFNTLNSYFNNLQNTKKLNFNLSILSMGMSGDYQIAIEEGSNMVRVGSSIFGERNYK